jgi:hypothetical protein
LVTHCCHFVKDQKAIFDNDDFNYRLFSHNLAYGVSQIFTWVDFAPPGDAGTGFGVRSRRPTDVYLAYQRWFSTANWLTCCGMNAPQQALANLRVVLACLRKPLELYLSISLDTIALNPDTPILIDVAEFEQCLDDTHTANGSNRVLAVAKAKEIERAVDLYRGNSCRVFTCGKPGFEAWLVQERDRCSCWPAAAGATKPW